MFLNRLAIDRQSLAAVCENGLLWNARKASVEKRIYQSLFYFEG
jgi:hypothetical protein